MLELALSVVVFVAAVVASGHAVIYKREPRAAALWIVVIWLVPAAGPGLYVLLGVNRVRRRAFAMRGDMVHHRTIPHVMSVNSPSQETVTPEPEQFRLFARLVERVSSRPLLPGNSLVPLVSGAEAYPAMLEAIESATESIGLATYIFDGAGAGKRFVEALVRSKERGVEVTCLDRRGGRKLFVAARFAKPEWDRCGPFQSSHSAARRARRARPRTGRTGFFGNRDSIRSTALREYSPATARLS